MNPASTPRPGAALCVGLVGAESTGKTALAAALQAGLAADGLAVAVVDETLRAFCDRLGRTPRAEEQLGIARSHTARIEAAAANHDIVLADTTALMTAVYSDFVFGDRSLYAEAEAAHRRCGLTLLTALDLPWVADGLQRDGPQVREPVDALVRAALVRAGGPWAIVAGQGEARSAHALAAVRRAWQSRLAAMDAPATGSGRWQWHCDRCGDPACERHLLPRTT